MLWEDTRTSKSPLLDGRAKGSKSCIRRALPFIVGFVVLIISCVVVMVLLRHDPVDNESFRSVSHQPRLRISNGCQSDSLWIANFAFQTPYFPQDVELKAGQGRDFMIPAEGLAATRFWAKWGCNRKGSECKIGESGGPGESCPTSGCAPPVDSKFEATFGCMPDSPNCAVNPSQPSEKLGPEDWWDVSQVDGWTLPYKVAVEGECDAPNLIDCSGLALSECPAEDSLGKAHPHESLQLFDPDDKKTVVGCYSPCAKLTYSQWGQGYSYTPESPEAQDFCCATPPVSPQQCSSGPVTNTAFVNAVHRLCPSVYAYAYDDGIGLAKCPAGTRYHVTFYCPA
ncbi:hypothetical protein AB1Y20_019699 [Prymnesium parvum]|uniref:Cellulase n=1 Tax=Prymnesium parvum TaxID=97485 RepID=A0AB34JRP6_PRYPA